MRTLLAILTLSAASATVHHSYDLPGGLRHVPSFHWTRPFPYDNTAPLNMETKCEVTKTFRAEQWKLKDLRAPSPWSDAIETFLGWHAYPGSWEGLDLEAPDREYLIMEYIDVPRAVREWVEKEHGEKKGEREGGRWWLYGVFDKPVEVRRYGDQGGDGTTTTTTRDEDKVLLFAPAALYEILPLWVGEGGECEAEMLDLSNHASHPTDNSVIAWPINHQIPDGKHGKKEIAFDIKAFYVLETEHGRAWKEMWERMYTTIRRQERKAKREERMAKRNSLGELEVDGESHARDEL